MEESEQLKPFGDAPLDNNCSEPADDLIDRPTLSPVADQLVAIAEKLRTGELSAALEDLTAAKQQSEVDQHHRARSYTETQADDLLARRERFAAKARAVYQTRRARGAIFGDPDLFGEPAWDILLDLYVAHVESKPVSVSSACIGSAAPPTTGLRWLGVLTENALIVREHDPEDQRRVLVRLSDNGMEAMDRYFAESLERSGG